MRPNDKAIILTDKIESNEYNLVQFQLCTEKYDELQGILDDIKYTNLSKKQRTAEIKPVRCEPKISRNQQCPCKSGKKYKNCCLNNIK